MKKIALIIFLAGVSSAAFAQTSQGKMLQGTPIHESCRDLEPYKNKDLSDFIQAVVHDMKIDASVWDKMYATYQKTSNPVMGARKTPKAFWCVDKTENGYRITEETGASAYYDFDKNGNYIGTDTSGGE